MKLIFEPYALRKARIGSEGGHSINTEEKPHQTIEQEEIS